MKKILSIHITPADGSLSDIYKQQIGGYPKFYKMDPLAKLGFIGSTLFSVLAKMPILKLS